MIPGTETRLGTVMLMDSFDVYEVKPGDVVEESDLSEIALGRYDHLLLKEVVDGEAFTSLEEWSCRTVLETGESCSPTGFEDQSLALVTLQPLQGRDELRFVSAESVRLTTEVLERVNLISCDLKRLMMDDSGFVASVLGPFLPNGEWPEEPCGRY